VASNFHHPAGRADVTVLVRVRGSLDKTEAELVDELRALLVKRGHACGGEVWAGCGKKHHALFLGYVARNTGVAMEGALKLREISYIHARSHPAGGEINTAVSAGGRRHASGHRRTGNEPGKAQIQPAGSAPWRVS
jgi:hypothetical protein